MVVIEKSACFARQRKMPPHMSVKGFCLYQVRCLKVSSTATFVGCKMAHEAEFDITAHYLFVTVEGSYKKKFVFGFCLNDCPLTHLPPETNLLMKSNK